MEVTVSEKAMVLGTQIPCQQDQGIVSLKTDPQGTENHNPYACHSLVHSDPFLPPLLQVPSCCNIYTAPSAY